MPSIDKLIFLWPSLLWLTALLPLLVVGYRIGLRRRRRRADGWRGLQAVGPAGGSRLGQWSTAGLLLTSLALLLVGSARPKVTMSLPIHAGTVLVAVDISGSMRAADTAPTRLEAARTALATFLAARPAGTRIGVVAFASSALLVHPPAEDRDAAVAAIRRLEPQRGTALCTGLLLALSTLLPDAGIEKIDQTSADETSPGGASRPRPAGPQRGTAGGRALGGNATADGTSKRQNDGRPSVPVEPGSNRSAAVVLLSDGQSNIGPDPRLAADIAASHGIRIFAVGLGTPQGESVSADGMSMRVRLDEPLMQHIAQTTGGTYFRAADSAGLPAIYRQIERGLTFGRRETMEVSALVIAAGAVLAAVAAMMSIASRGRVL